MVGIVVWLASLRFGGQGGLFLVIPEVELHKEDEEEHHESRGDHGLVDWEVALIAEGQLEAVQSHTNELKHLEFGQVSLPPQIFLESGSKSG